MLQFQEDLSELTRKICRSIHEELEFLLLKLCEGSLLAPMKVEEKTGLDNEVVVSSEEVLISHSNLSCVSEHVLNFDIKCWIASPCQFR